MAELEFADTKVIYEWDVDRFRHRLAIRTPDGWLDLMESVEGTSSDPWPPSPPGNKSYAKAWGTEAKMYCSVWDFQGTDTGPSRSTLPTPNQANPTRQPIKASRSTWPAKPANLPLTLDPPGR